MKGLARTLATDEAPRTQAGGERASTVAAECGAVCGADRAPASGLTHHYTVFGGCLRSEVEFPDLSRVNPRPPDWTLRVATEAPPAPVVVEELGRHDIGWSKPRLTRSDAGLHLSYAPYGECTIAADGSELTWYPGQESLPEIVRAVVLGPALALALHLRGTLTLHGSAVGLGGHAIAVLAPRFHGKSTLALALVRAGATLVTDDSIAVDVDGVPTVRPGVHSVRV